MLIRCATQQITPPEVSLAAKLRNYSIGLSVRPAFLGQESEWPKQPDEVLPEDDRELKKKKVQVRMLAQKDSLQPLLSRYSSLLKLTSVAWLSDSRIIYAASLGR